MSLFTFCSNRRTLAVAASEITELKILLGERINIYRWFTAIFSRPSRIDVIQKLYYFQQVYAQETHSDVMQEEIYLLMMRL